MSEPPSVDVYRAPNSDFSVAPRERRGWSRHGAASIVIGIVSTLTFVAVIVSEALRNTGDRSHASEAMQEPSTLVGVLALLSMTGLLAGISLGVAGLLQTRRTRGLALAGLILNAFVALSLALLIAIGLMLDR